MEAFEDALDRHAKSSSSIGKQSKAEEDARLPPPPRPPPARRRTPDRSLTKRKSWYKRPALVWVGILLILGILAGATAYVTLHAKRHQQGDAGSISASNATLSSDNAPASKGANQTRSNSATPLPTSSSVKMPPANRPFYGVAYEPPGLPNNCDFTEAQVRTDLQLMATITSRIRIYTHACNQSDMVLNIIDQDKLDLSVAVGVDMVTGVQGSYALNDTHFHIEAATTLRLAQLHAPKLSHIVVGNEVLLKYLTQNQAPPTAQLIQNINLFRKSLEALQLPQPIPICTSEAPAALVIGGQPLPELLAAVDGLFANIHPWWGNVPAAGAVANLDTQWNNLLAQYPDSKAKFILGETGWPSTEPGQPVFKQETGPADTSISGLVTYLTFVCDWNTRKQPFFFFQGVDEPGKAPEDDPRNGVENHWGLYTTDRKLKTGVTLPACAAP